MSDKTFGKKQWIELLSATGLNEEQMNTWHRLFEQRYPESHQAFLSWLGLSDAEAAKVRKHASN